MEKPNEASELTMKKIAKYKAAVPCSPRRQSKESAGSGMKAIPKMLILRNIFVVAVGLFLMCSTVLGQDTPLLHRMCNKGVFGYFDNRKGLVQYMVDKTVYNTNGADGYELYLKDHVGGDFIYSHGLCFEYLTKDECLKCMESAKEQMYQDCSKDGMGAQIELTSCRLRYELYYFNNDG